MNHFISSVFTFISFKKKEIFDVLTSTDPRINVTFFWQFVFFSLCPIGKIPFFPLPTLVIKIVGNSSILCQPGPTHSCASWYHQRPNFWSVLCAVKTMLTPQCGIAFPHASVQSVPYDTAEFIGPGNKSQVPAGSFSGSLQKLLSHLPPSILLLLGPG